MIKKFENYSNGLDDVTNTYHVDKEELTRISQTEEEIIRGVFSKYNVCSLTKTTISNSSQNYDTLQSTKMYTFKKVIIKKSIRTIESILHIDKDINDYFFIHYESFPQGDFYNTHEKKIFKIDFPDLEKGFKYFIENYLIKR